MNPKNQLIVALDVFSFDEMRDIVEAIGDNVSIYKVGHQLFTAEGPKVIQFLKDLKKDVLLDLKLHEIPNSVASAIRSAGKHGVDMVTIHATGGRKMMEAAVEAGNNLIVDHIIENEAWLSHLVTLLSPFIVNAYY